MTITDDRPAVGTTRRRTRRWMWLAGGAAVALAVFVLAWFEPHKLFIDERVDEAIPTVTSAPGSSAPGSSATPSAEGGDTPATVPPAEPVERARGEFISLDHGTSGVARVLELADGRRIVRLEGLDTDNGPDLYLYLTTNDADGPEGGFDDDFVSLGRLKGNQGDQNYDVPGDTSLDRFGTVVIWCDRFDSAFGAADLLRA
jgi:hypothetical protein